MQSLVTKPVVFLVGPTASGKTAHAYRLVDAMRDVGKVADGTGSSLFEIVSVDSALVYKDMNIGTAKPSAAELAVYPHRLIDLITPEEAYSAADFRRDALASIAEIHARGRVPLLVGGTMMYVKALVDGLSALPPADAALRVEIEADSAREGWPALHARLARIDPATAARLKPNDAQRIQRALEVYRLVGVPLSELQTRSASASDWAYPSLYLGLMPHERTSLHARIARRFDAMLDAGLVDEVRQLRKTYRLTPELPSMRCVGYRQTWAYLDGEFNLDECRRTAIVATRQLAKRQMTWMRSMPQLRCFDSESAETGAQLEAAVRDMLDATTQSGT